MSAITRVTNYVDRVRSFAYNFSHAAEGFKVGPYTFPIGWGATPSWPAFTYGTFVRDGYMRNSIIHRCISYKAQTAALAKLRAYDKDFSLNQRKLLADSHALQELCRYPNPWMSDFEFMELCITYLNVSGNCYIVRDTDNQDDNGRVMKKGLWPKALWPVRPDRMRPVPFDGKILGYIYEPYGVSGVYQPTQGHIEGEQDRRIPLRPDQVIHIKYPNPDDPFEGLGEGLSPMFAAARPGEIDNRATDFIAAFFKNSGVISGLLKTKQKLVDTEIDRVKRRWREMYAGEFGTQWDIAVLDMDTEYQKMGLSFSEMQIDWLDFRNEARVCMAFGIHPGVAGTVLGITRNTYSNPEEARRAFWQDTMMVEYQRFEVEVSKVLRDPQRGISVAYDYSNVPALQTDIKDKATNYTLLVRSAVPPNVAARVVALPIDVIDGGDKPLIASGMVTLKQVLTGETSSHQSGGGAGSGNKPTPETVVPGTNGSGPKSFTPYESIKEVLAAELDSKHVMLAFYPDPMLANLLKVQGGELPEELHMTVALVKKPLPRNEQLHQLAHTVSLVIPMVEVLTGKVGGVGTFKLDDGEYAHYASVDMPGLPAWRESLLAALSGYGYEFQGDHGYSPHITLLYSPDQRIIPIVTQDVVYQVLAVVDGNLRYNISLKDGAIIGSDVIAPRLAEGGYKLIRGYPAPMQEDEPSERELEEAFRREQQIWSSVPELAPYAESFNNGK